LLHNHKKLIKPTPSFKNRGPYALDIFNNNIYYLQLQLLHLHGLQLHVELHFVEVDFDSAANGAATNNTTIKLNNIFFITSFLF